MAADRRLGMHPSADGAMVVAHVGSADAPQPPASGHRSELLRLIGRGVLVAAGAIGISLLISEVKTASASTDAPDDSAATAQADPAVVDAATETPDDGVVPEPDVLASVTELLAPVTDAVAPLIETVTPLTESLVGGSLVGGDSASESPAATSAAAPATATEVVAASDSSPSSSVTELVAPVTDVLEPVVMSVVGNEAPSASDPAMVQAALAPAGAVTAESSGGVAPAPTSLTGLLTGLGLTDLVDPVLQPLAPVIDLVDPVVAPVVDLVEPVLAPVAKIVEPVVAPVVDLAVPVVDVLDPVVVPVADAVDKLVPVARSLPVVGGLVADAKVADTVAGAVEKLPARITLPAETVPSAAESTPPATPAVTPLVASPAAAETHSAPAAVSTDTATVTHPAAAAASQISADTDPVVGPSVETQAVSSGPSHGHASVELPAQPRDVKHPAVGPAPGVNTATSSSASHGDQAVVLTAAAPPGGSAGEKVQLESAALSDGVAANRVPTPE